MRKPATFTVSATHCIPYIITTDLGLLYNRTIIRIWPYLSNSGVGFALIFYPDKLCYTWLDYFTRTRWRNGTAFPNGVVNENSRFNIHCANVFPLGILLDESRRHFILLIQIHVSLSLRVWVRNMVLFSLSISELMLNDRITSLV